MAVRRLASSSAPRESRISVLEASFYSRDIWGAVLALEYALRHPTRVSHLILMNPAPVSATDLAVLHAAYFFWIRS